MLAEFKKVILETAKKLIKNHFTLVAEIEDKQGTSRLLELIYKLAPKQFLYYEYLDGESGHGELRVDSTIVIKLKKMKAFYIIQTNGSYSYGNRATDFTIYITGKDAYKARAMLLKYLYPKNGLTDNAVTVYEQVLVDGISGKSTDSVTWKAAQQVPAKTMDNIIMDEGEKKRLLSYLSKWRSATDLFKSLEVSHKTGLLLYGEPGTGKTSLAKSLGSYLDCPVYTVNLSNFSDKTIESIKDISGDELAIILMEDIDYIFGKRQADRSPEEKAAGQALLQLLDGVANVTNKIFIATTNYVRSLDDAIVRDGRFDLKINLKQITEWDEASELCKSIGINKKEDIEIVIARAGLPVTPAKLQNTAVQYLFEHMGE